jgi:hypothetical protein
MVPQKRVSRLLVWRRIIGKELKSNASSRGYRRRIAIGLISFALPDATGASTAPGICGLGDWHHKLSGANWIATKCRTNKR